jgi:hypothetical protein
MCNPAGESGEDLLVRKIFFLPDSDYLDDEQIMMDKKRCPILTCTKPVPRHVLRTILNLHHIVPQVRPLCKMFQGERNTNPLILG